MSAGSSVSAARALQRRVEVLAERCATLSGWRRWLTSALAGGGAALAMPPLGLVPLLFVAFPILIWAVDGTRGFRGAFVSGWCFGFGYFVVGLYWIANALLIEPERFAWLLPFAVAGLPALLAIFTGLAAAAYRRFGGRGSGRVLAFAALWAAAEWVRGNVFTGFPWNLTGYAWAPSEGMLQVTAIIGIYGLSLVTLAAVAAPAALWSPERADGTRGTAPWALPAGMLAVLALLWGGGLVRLAGAENGTVEGVRLRIVQANIPQQLKWDDNQRVANVRRFLDLSASPAAPGADPPTHIIWPETAVPFFLNEEPLVISALARIAPEGGVVVTGTPRIHRGASGPTIWNSVIAIDSTGEIAATYDKFHLVPFGEYVPFREWIGLSKITAGAVDFTPGPGPRTVILPGVPAVSPLVCYEVIFPGRVTDPQARPSWLLNVTNDGWYGRSAGPYQHLQIARVRAVEEGLPLVRAANTGISAVVDPYGRILHALPLERTGVIDSPLPERLPGPTVYARYGDALFFGLLGLLALAARLWGRASPERRTIS